MARYVVLLRGAEATLTVLDDASADFGFAVIDRTGNDAFLIEATAASVDRLRVRFPRWIVAEQVTHPPPRPSDEDVHRFDSDDV